MIRALVTGDLRADPQQRVGKDVKPYALARLSVPMDDQGRLPCSLIVFEDEAVTRLLQLRAGASVTAGTLKVGTFDCTNGAIRASLDLTADEIAATTPRPKKPRPAPAHRGHQGGAAVGAPFADDVDWMGA